MADNAPLNARTDAILRRLVRKEAGASLRKVLAKARPEDIAAAMEHLLHEEQRRLFRSIEDKNTAATVLVHLGDEAVREVAKDLTKEQVVDLLERMEPDDATDVVEMLPDELRRRVISEINRTEEVELANLLAYPPDTAGGIMSTVVFKMTEEHTCGEAISELQAHAEELDSVFYLYVVDARNRLAGVVSLRTLLIHSPTTPLVSIMNRDVISVGPSQDQEEVARYVARYDLLAVPVVDEEKRLLGIVTVDDVVDVIREEAAEDMMLMAGVPEEAEFVQAPPVRLARIRASWLLMTLFGGVVASELVSYYDGRAKELLLLATFLPVVMGMGGNVGTQSATIAVRGLAVGHLELGGAMPFLWREARVGVMLGAGFGTILGVYSLIRHWPDLTQAILVTLALPVSLTIASLWGAGVPMFMSRIGVDPAIATGPVVATTLDIVGILVYFNVALLVLQALS